MTVIVEDARVKIHDVKNIIDTGLGDEDIGAFINVAHRVVVDRLTGQGVSEDTLFEIERWLSAHFLAIRDRQVESEKIGNEYSAKYQGKTGMFLSATLYGQMAQDLDTSGKLKEAGKAKANFDVHGTNDPQVVGPWKDSLLRDP